MERRVYVVPGEKDETIHLKGQLSQILGAHPDQTQGLTYKAPFPADIRAGFYTLYVYGDMVSHQRVRDSYVPLLRGKIVNADGTNIAAGAKVGFVNYPIASLFSQVDATLGDRLISQSSNCYPYRAVLKGLLNYSQETLHSQFATGLFYKDTLNKLEETDPDGENTSFKKRSTYTAGSRTVELLGQIHIDLFFQEKLILNGIDVKIKMVQNKDEFCLMSGDAECYKVIITSASLFVKKVKVSPAVKLGHAYALTSANAKYPVERVNIKVFSMPAGIRVCNQKNLFLGQLPKYVVIGIVDNEAFSGSSTRNPFNFKHNDVEFLALYMDSEQIPAKPFQPDFASGYSAREYYNLVLATGKHLKDQALSITHSEFSQGYTVFAFDLTPDQECGGRFSLVKTGNMSFELCFHVPLPWTVNLIVYAIFDNIIEINQRRNVLYDY
ncbi:uncharacterized protein F54H12.2-like [Polypterus senegalus]|uniref:uncharacterized protein F54H12.2-like n=1 Tax=Polypterus senegalus TaxID=55291 RepID=UPI0019625A50|nr:uncharacterized protein F54H12.2-like [Polypterus senegalus]